MKWLFRIIGLILLIFIGLIIFGFTRPATQTVESSVIVGGDRDTVYAVMADLQTYPEWAGFGDSSANWVYGGAADGVGQSAAWQADEHVGSLEILQAQPGEFVMVQTNGPLGDRLITLAVDEQGETTLFLVQAELDLGGFPYLGRVVAGRQTRALQTALDQASLGMAQLFPVE